MIVDAEYALKLIEEQGKGGTRGEVLTPIERERTVKARVQRASMDTEVAKRVKANEEYQELQRGYYNQRADEWNRHRYVSAETFNEEYFASKAQEEADSAS